jgi:hypothetical protein
MFLIYGAGYEKLEEWFDHWEGWGMNSWDEGMDLNKGA